MAPRTLFDKVWAAHVVQQPRDAQHRILGMGRALLARRDRERPARIGRDQQDPFALILEQAGQLAAGGRFAGPL